MSHSVAPLEQVVRRGATRRVRRRAAPAARGALRLLQIVPALWIRLSRRLVPTRLALRDQCVPCRGGTAAALARAWARGARHLSKF